jgi:hypothetical protein
MNGNHSSDSKAFIQITGPAIVVPRVNEFSQFPPCLFDTQDHIPVSSIIVLCFWFRNRAMLHMAKDMDLVDLM